MDFTLFNGICKGIVKCKMLTVTYILQKDKHTFSNGKVQADCVLCCIGDIVHMLTQCSAFGTDHLTCRGGGGSYGFLFRTEFFFRTTRELEYLFCLSRLARIFFPELNIRLYDKNSESDYYFPHPPSPKSEYFFSATLGIRIFF